VLPLFEKHAGQKIIVVCHAVVLRLMMAYFENFTIDEYWKVQGFFFPCSITSVSLKNGNFVLLQRNSIEHSK
jgi:probable phosphoglycerate mutase